ncbi:DUF3291 domain-containing protein [Streptomyces buecherae]|uniref:DUF3291 domain-containing protein n=1 Tax=Streptomyces buecherae TaxID=2763006 RepID=UPI0036C4FAFF
MPHLALYTFGVLRSPLTDPSPLAGEFLERGEAIYQKISQHPGYLAHAEAADGERGAHFDLDWGAWGEFAVPAWYGKGRTVDTMALAASLSLWTDLRPAFDAVYTGLHRAALNRRHDWFERSAHPGYVFWWVPEGATPTWQDGVSRLEHLHDHGPAPHAFTFHHAFTPEATPTRVTGIGPKDERVR